MAKLIFKEITKPKPAPVPTDTRTPTGKVRLPW